MQSSPEGETKPRKESSTSQNQLPGPGDMTPRIVPVHDGCETDTGERSFFEAVNDAIAVHDIRSFRFIDINQRFTEMFGYTLAEMQTGGIGLLAAGDRNYREEDVLQSLREAAKGRSQIYEAQAYRKTGEQVWMEVSLKRGKIRGQDCLLALIRDVTDRKRAEWELRESERKFRSLFESSHDALLMIDENGIFDCNRKALELYGLSSKEDVIGRNPGEFSPAWQPDGRNSIEGAIENYQTALKEGARLFEWIHFRSDGTHIITEVLLHRLELGGKKVIQALIWDIGERKRSEEKLQRYQERLRTLALDLSLVQERERRRIATDLHDHIGQNLAFSKMKLGALREAVRGTSLLDPLEEVYALVVQTIEDTRSLVFELSPPVLYELGFEAGVEWLAERIQAEYGIPVECEHDRVTKPLEEEIRIVLFQIVRELLLNVAKHAQAGKVKVTISRERGRIRLAVEDNGIGFNSTQIGMKKGEKTGFGLFSIRERMNYLGGELWIDSAAKLGTRVILRVPINRKRKRKIKDLPHEYQDPDRR